MQRLQICAAAVAIVCVGAVARPIASQDAVEAARLIGSLDACVQERFREVDKVFGYRRLMRPGETAHRFRPENLRELDSVRDLERAHLQVVLYLASREVLRSRPEPIELRASSAIKGPALVAPDGLKISDAPPPRQLWDESRRALESFGRLETRTFTLEGWTFAARPVRASDQSCLNCHRADALRVGDPIGTVLYGYRRQE